MKTILVPTDFSKNASKAALYALRLAEAIQARVVLFHVYSSDLVSTDLPISYLTGTDYKTASRQQLKKFATWLNKYNSAGIAISVSNEFGIPSDEILRKAEASKAGLIVMGAKGESGALERMFGNTTSTVARKSKIPVLAIPENARYKQITNVLVASDHGNSFTLPIIHALQKLSETFKAPLTMLKVVHLGEYMVRGGGIPREHKVEEKLAGTPHSYDFEVSAEAVDGINTAAAKARAGLVVIIAHKHTLLARFFNGTTTGRIIRKSAKPVLVLPEKVTEKRATRIFEKETVNA